MGHSHTALYYHVVFGTKNRRNQITDGIRTRLYDYIGGIVKGEDGALLTAGGMPDHVHVLIALHPSTCVADMMRRLKTNSSKWVHETWPEHQSFAWQAGYGAFTVSESNLDQVRTYIANQETHHSRMSFEEEFVAFLERHKIAYNSEYLWA